MTNAKDMELSKVLNILDSINETCCLSEICKINSAQKDHYAQLLTEFERFNKIPKSSPMAPANLHNLKGAALEALVKYLLKISGGIFETTCNLRTCTNEIDDLIKLSPKGRVLLKYNLINNRLCTFLGECKNYDQPVSVTYVGKFCSLLLTNHVKLGILFSYHGVSGSGWNHGSGLIKKFYLHKENLEDRYCIINFTINEFKSILADKNLLQIIEEQLDSLQFDTDYSRHLSKHPAE